jgi:hypothetical protein
MYLTFTWEKIFWNKLHDIYVSIHFSRSQLLPAVKLCIACLLTKWQLQCQGIETFIHSWCRSNGKHSNNDVNNIWIEIVNQQQEQTDEYHKYDNHHRSDLHIILWTTIWRWNFIFFTFFSNSHKENRASHFELQFKTLLVCEKKQNHQEKHTFVHSQQYHSNKHQ